MNNKKERQTPYKTQIALSYVQGGYIYQELEDMFRISSTLFQRIEYDGETIGWHFMALNRQFELYVCRQNFISFASEEERFCQPFETYFELFSKNNLGKSVLVLQESTHTLDERSLWIIMRRILSHTSGLLPPQTNKGWFTHASPHRNVVIDEKSRSERMLFDGLWRELLT